MKLEDWLIGLWEDYAAMAPQAASIRSMLEERGEHIVDDHVAFRTLNLAPIGLARLGAVVEALGYEPFDDYVFEEKRLQARSYVHPDAWPRVFLSELLVEELEQPHQELLQRLVAQIDTVEVGPETFTAGRLWEPIDYREYLDLREATEYGAWVAALGLRPNHFTIDVNALESFRGLGPLLDFVYKRGFELNESGGRVKGSPEVLLQQASTIADRMEVEFAGGERHLIPTCYYEFALRYPTATGMYDGFVAQSADRIFESTDARN